MITFKEWWSRRFLNKEHQYTAELAWEACYTEFEKRCNLRIAEAISTQRELIEQLEKSAALTQQNVMNDKAIISTQQAEIDRLKGQRDRLIKQLTESQRELIEWDNSLRISAEFLGDSKPTRLPIQKIINMNKALIAEIEAGND